MKKNLIVLILMLFSCITNLNAIEWEGKIISYSIIGREIDKVTVNMPAKITILKGDHSNVKIVVNPITEKQIKCVVSKGNLIVMMDPRYLDLLDDTNYIHIFVTTSSNNVKVNTRNKTTLGIKKTKNGYHNKK